MKRKQFKEFLDLTEKKGNTMQIKKTIKENPQLILEVLEEMEKEIIDNIPPDVFYDQNAVGQLHLIGHIKERLCE